MKQTEMMSYPLPARKALLETSVELKLLHEENARLREALECMIYALEHPHSDQVFAMNAAVEALTPNAKLSGPL